MRPGTCAQVSDKIWSKKKKYKNEVGRAGDQNLCNKVNSPKV